MWCSTGRTSSWWAVLRSVRTAGSAAPTANDACRIIYALCACHGNLYAVMKKVMELREGVLLGGVRRPLPDIIPEDMPQIKKCIKMIDETILKLV